MIKIKEFMEMVGYLFVFVCVGEFVASIVVDRLRLNKIAKITKECKELSNQLNNKWSDYDEQAN